MPSALWSLLVLIIYFLFFPRYFFFLTKYKCSQIKYKCHIMGYIWKTFSLHLKNK